VGHVLISSLSGRDARGRGKSSGALYDIKPVNPLAGALNALAAALAARAQK